MGLGRGLPSEARGGQGERDLNAQEPLADLIGGALMIDAGAAAIERALENLRLNELDERAFVLICKAVGEKPGEVLFTDIGGASTQNQVVAQPDHGSEGRRVEMTTIDDELEKLGRQATFIKTDVEGHDLAALKGAVRALRSGPVRLVKFEHNQSETLAPLLDFSDSLGWVMFALDASGRPTTETPRHVERNMNLFAATPELLSQLR